MVYDPNRISDESVLNQLGKARISSDRFSELLGFARGVAADNKIVPDELEQLYSWVCVHEAALTEPTAQLLIDAIKQAYCATEDIKKTACDSLLQVIHAFTGGILELGELPKTNSLCLDNPAPRIKFWGMQFVFSGSVKPADKSNPAQTKKACEQEVISLDGVVATSITQATDYLVVAGSAHTAWKHTNGGSKIQKAMKMRDKGHHIKIVSEEHWQKAVLEAQAL